MININSYPQTIVDEKIKLLDRIRHELLSSLKTEPSQYVINRLDLIDRKLTQLHKKSCEWWCTHGLVVRVTHKS